MKGLVIQMQQQNLAALGAGESGRVYRLNVGEALRRRLLDLGLTGGTGVTCLLKGAGGNISAYAIRGAVIAIRKSDADHILLS